MIAITGLVFLIVGLVLGGAGIWLITVGGSWFYAVAALVFIVTAFLIWRRRGAALWLYAAFIICTLAWSMRAVGFDWWRMGPRGGVIVLLALWLLTPWVRRRLRGSGTEGLVMAVLLALVVAGYSMTVDPYDLAGTVGTDKVSAAPRLSGDISPDECHDHGRTVFDPRYLPLTKI
jgi:quinoprotein glucose dehydrogenase